MLSLECKSNALRMCNVCVLIIIIITVFMSDAQAWNKEVLKPRNGPDEQYTNPWQQGHCPVASEHVKVRFSECSHALLSFSCLLTKESQDFLMPKMGSSQQIDIYQGTVHSLEMSWTEKEENKKAGWRAVWFSFHVKGTHINLWICLSASSLSEKQPMDPFCLDVSMGESNNLYKMHNYKLL